MNVEINGRDVRGRDLDSESRCAHYAGGRDVVAIRFACCDDYFACIHCHEETTDHETTQWPADRRDEAAVLCGACGSALTIRQYVGATECPECGAPFNPDCADHYDRYFEDV